jgi:ectoine hydroxylase-related dioxygenase (phytanoyl-CoA dioxygenase family)
MGNQQSTVGSVKEPHAIGAGRSKDAAHWPRRFDARSDRVVDDALEQVRDVGFCVVDNLLSTAAVARVRGSLGRLLRAERGANLQPSGHQRILHLLAKDAIFAELLCHPVALAIWRKQLGEDMLCSTMTGNSLLPGCTEQYWHADYPYWTFPQPYPAYPLSGQVIWMIDGFTPANGGTAGIPYSHRNGSLPKMGRRWVDNGVVMTGAAGSAVFADGAWWHTSRPNRTGRIRHSVIVSYIRGYCVTQEDMLLQLSAIADPSEELQALLGAKRYVPTRGFPY